MCLGMSVEVSRQLAAAGFFLPPCEESRVVRLDSWDLYWLSHVSGLLKIS